MKTLDLLKKSFRNMILMGTMIVNLFSVTWLSAQQTMSLGNLRFVLPDETATRASRTIRMRMAGADNISSLYYNIVGGIAFTQQAVPDFNVRDVDVYYSSEDNKAHISINGQYIIIPLEMFELQPIVNYANSEDEVLMTLYGGWYGTINNSESQEILFHPAFIDNMMGLRLLQVDAMTMLEGKNGEFPVIDGGTLCMTNSESEKYSKLNQQLEGKGSNYIDNGRKAYQEIIQILPSNISSYIYTDINQPIHFSIDNNSISFSGLPYYQFSTIAENDVDPLSYYYYMKFVFNNYENLLPSIIESQRELIIEIYEPYFNEEEMTALLDTLQSSYEEYYASIAKAFAEFDNQPGKSDEQKANELIQKIQEGLQELEMPELTQLIQSDLSLAFPMQVSANEVTNELIKRPELIRQLNPIVYQEVDDICHWSALFRFVKTSNLSAWTKFVSQVNAATPEGPAVKTPIRLL